LSDIHGFLTYILREDSSVVITDTLLDMLGELAKRK
jgi:hypothetical protein